MALAVLKILFFFWCLLCVLGAGTFGTVRAGVYKPKNGGAEVECAIKVLKPAEELGNQKVEFLCSSQCAIVLLSSLQLYYEFSLVTTNGN